MDFARRYQRSDLLDACGRYRQANAMRQQIRAEQMEARRAVRARSLEVIRLGGRDAHVMATQRVPVEASTITGEGKRL